MEERSVCVCEDKQPNISLNLTTTTRKGRKFEEVDRNIKIKADLLTRVDWGVNWDFVKNIFFFYFLLLDYFFCFSSFITDLNKYSLLQVSYAKDPLHLKIHKTGDTITILGFMCVVFKVVKSQRKENKKTKRSNLIYSQTKHVPKVRIAHSTRPMVMRSPRERRKMNNVLFQALKQ